METVSEQFLPQTPEGWCNHWVKKMPNRQSAAASSSAGSSHGLHEELVQVRSLQLPEGGMGANHKQRSSWEETKMEKCILEQRICRAF